MKLFIKEIFNSMGQTLRELRGFFGPFGFLAYSKAAGLFILFVIALLPLEIVAFIGYNLVKTVRERKGKKSS